MGTQTRGGPGEEAEGGLSCVQVGRGLGRASPVLALCRPRSLTQPRAQAPTARLEAATLVGFPWRMARAWSMLGPGASGHKWATPRGLLVLRADCS